MTTTAERAFHQDMVTGLDTLKRDLNYNATRFAQMLGQYGGVGAAKRLLTGDSYSEGFTTLWERRRLDMSVEFFVLLPWYRSLFTDVEERVARQRLIDYGFDVDGAISRASRKAPAWWEGNAEPS